MCDFFSFVTEPEKHGGKRFYFNWKYRSAHLTDDKHDSHSSICKHYGLDEDVCNKYEFNPLTKEFKIDKINSEIDDRLQAEDWVNKVNFKRIAKPLIIKPIVNPFDLPKVEHVTDEHIELLKQRASVWASVRDSVWSSVWASVWDSVGASVWASVRVSVGVLVWYSVWDSVKDSVKDSVRDSVWDSVRDSVWDSVRAYISSFFDIKYQHDFSACVKLWESGLVPSYDGKTWRLHSGKNADVVYEYVEVE